MKTKKEIKKGDRYFCIKTLKMKPTKEKRYFKGFIYNSDNDGCITNSSENKLHHWTVNTKLFKKTFIKLKSKENE